MTNCSLLNETFLDEPTVKNTSCGTYLQECIKADNQSQFLQDNVTGLYLYKKKLTVDIWCVASSSGPLPRLNLVQIEIPVSILTMPLGYLIEHRLICSENFKKSSHQSHKV